MKIVVVFVFPHAAQYFNSACRFLLTYNKHPAGAEHRLIVVSNGGPPTLEMSSAIDLFNHDVEILVHDNSGWDIGADQLAARKFPCDMMVFFGATSYLRGPKWLARMAEAFDRFGPSAIYGCMANTGNTRVGVWPHIRTTGYWMAPTMMNLYPTRVTERRQRYPFEHGPNNITQWFRERGHKALMVTWHGEYEYPIWNRIHNGFHSGNQSELIAGDRLSAPPFYHCG